MNAIFPWANCVLFLYMCQRSLQNSGFVNCFYFVWVCWYFCSPFLSLYVFWDNGLQSRVKLKWKLGEQHYFSYLFLTDYRAIIVWKGDCSKICFSVSSSIMIYWIECDRSNVLNICFVFIYCNWVSNFVGTKKLKWLCTLTLMKHVLEESPPPQWQQQIYSWTMWRVLCGNTYRYY